MKELSIEEKAKRYDEALKVLHKYDGANIMFTQDLKEEMFPELKESEDERIRKEIMDFATKANNGVTSILANNYDFNKWIAWLEKQGEQSNWKPSKDEMDALYGLAYITNKMDDKKDEAITKLYQDLKREFFNGSSYENMFSNTEDGVRRRSTIQILEYARSLDAYNQYGKADIDKNIAWLEKQGEQKHADKVEPKFKIGDWVVINPELRFASPLCIRDIDNNNYRVESVDGNSGTPTIDYLDNHYHLWTIQDAKDGDVLVSSSGKPFIFKGFFDNDPMAYGGLVADDSFWPASNSNWTTVYCKPATKEQRDILFQKMKEAGYEWDAEKKELKKVEQKPNFFHHEVDLSNCSEEYCKAYYDGWNNCNQQHSQLKAEQKPAEWTMDNIEELTEFENAMMHIGGSFFGEHQGLDPNDTFVVKEQAKILLEMAPKQEWSEEDENFLNTTIAYLKDAKEFKKTAENCIKWLKSLRPQSQWKPSDEQMMALRRMKAAIAGEGEIYKPLNSLYEDLKKLKE